MNKKYFLSTLRIVLALSLAACVSDAAAVDTIDLSGSYSLVAGKGQTTMSTVRIEQTADSVEITQVDQGKTATNRHPLDGSDVSCKDTNAVHGQCTAHIQGKTLVLDRTVVSKPQPSIPAIRFHEREQWQLSSDKKTLTIKSSMDAPDAAREISNAIFGSMNSTQKYVRSNP